MNKRIQALAEQAGQESFDSEHTALLQVSTEHTMYEVPAGFIVKFAELIVRECIDVGIAQKKWVENQEVIDPRDEHWNLARIQQSQRIVDKIREHFGVES